MARYNEILVGRYNRFLQKLLGMKGGVVAPQLASEITAAFPLFNGAENRYLEQWDMFGVNLFLAGGGVGNISQVRLFNPAASNTIAVVYKLCLVGVANDAPFLKIGAATVANIGTSNQASVQQLE